MGLFNEEQVKRLNKMGVYVEENKDYTDNEKKEFLFKINDFIYSHSTKNNDIPNLLNENSDIINKLQEFIIC